MPLLYQDSVLQTAYTELTANATSTATTFTGSLLSLTVTTGANPVIIHFSASCQHGTATQRQEFRLVQDGVAKRGIGIFSTSNLNGNSGSLVYKTATLTAGSHTFLVQWRVTTGTGAFNITTSVIDHASLYLEEVTV